MRAATPLGHRYALLSSVPFQVTHIEQFPDHPNHASPNKAIGHEITFSLRAEDVTWSVMQCLAVFHVPLQRFTYERHALSIVYIKQVPVSPGRKLRSTLGRGLCDEMRVYNM